MNSFSFRTGVLITLSFSVVLLSLRVILYQQAVLTTENDIRAIIQAYSNDIRQSMQTHGDAYVRTLIPIMLEDTPDKHLLLGYKEGDFMEGNIPVWPEEEDLSRHWKNITLSGGGNVPPIDAIAQRLVFPSGLEVIVGYDLDRVEILERTLVGAIIINIIIAICASIGLTALILFLLNRHMRRFNHVCTSVMAGKLNKRVQRRGGNDEFEKLAGNLNAMLDWNTMLLKTVKDSSNAIAHDMRTPLSRLRNILAATLQHVDDRKLLEERISDAIAQADMMAEMFDQMLTITKAESRAGSEVFESFDVKEMLEDVSDFYSPVVEQKRHQFTLNVPSETVMYHGDRQLLTQACLNLLDNAIKYTPSGGCIELSLTLSAQAMEITIADSGVGIPEHLYERVKERFFRIDKSRNTPGSGLGLSLVQAVATLHLGEFVLSDNAPGLKATLVLPR